MITKIYPEDGKTKIIYKNPVKDGVIAFGKDGTITVDTLSSPIDIRKEGRCLVFSVSKKEDLMKPNKKSNAILRYIGSFSSGAIASGAALTVFTPFPIMATTEFSAIGGCANMALDHILPSSIRAFKNGFLFGGALSCASRDYIVIGISATAMGVLNTVRDFQAKKERIQAEEAERK